MTIKDNYDVVVIGAGPGGWLRPSPPNKTGRRTCLSSSATWNPVGSSCSASTTASGWRSSNRTCPDRATPRNSSTKRLLRALICLLDTMVLDITPDRRIFTASRKGGIREIRAKALVLAMGCRERTRAQVRLPGTRPAGVYTAGTAQRWVNVEGFMPGKSFVILGSGDIGMIMARRLTFEGAKVERVLEVMPFLTGLTRNYVQCLLDYDIELQLQHTVKRIIGNNRVEAIEAVAVDEKWEPIPGSEEIIPCDTLLLSVGLIPENELSRKAGVALDLLTAGPFVDDRFETSVPGVFAAGNVVHVYDLVDWVTQAGLVSGKAAAQFAHCIQRPEAEKEDPHPQRGERSPRGPAAHLPGELAGSGYQAAAASEAAGGGSGVGGGT